MTNIELSKPINIKNKNKDEVLIGRKTEAPNKLSSQNNVQDLSLSTRYSDIPRVTLPVKRTIINFNFKFVLIGNISVGKSSIIKRYINNTYDEEYICTVGTELLEKSLSIGENNKINLFIWDTCGQERFRCVTRQYYKDTQAILLVFDLTDEKSFEDLSSWIEEAICYTNNENCMFFLFGNKSDEKDKRKVGKDEIKSFMKKYPKIKKYFEVSALNGDNIEISFEKVCQFLVMLYQGDGIDKEFNEYKKRKLSSSSEIEKSGKCC